MYSNIAEMRRLIKVIECCKKGTCSECEYTDNCMDGIIDDTYDFLIELEKQFVARNQALD